MHFALLIAFSFALPVSIRECLRRHAAQGRTEAIGDIHHVSLERTEEGLFTIRSCSPALHNLLQFFFFTSFHSFWNRHHCHLFYWSITGASLAICSYRKTKNRCFVTSADARRSQENRRRRRHSGLSGGEGGCLLLMHTTSWETFRVLLRAKVNVFSVAEVEGRAACWEVEARTKHPPRPVRVSFVPAQVVEIIDSFLLVLFLSHFLSRRCCLVSGVFLLSHSCFYEPLFSRPFAWRGSAKKKF